VFESNNAIEWFRANGMIVNPDKFQSTIFDKKAGDENTYTLNFDNKIVQTSPEVILLGIEIDKKF
jgi:hypothetical protein